MVEPDHAFTAENPANSAQALPSGAWAQLLESTIAGEILPVLLAATSLASAQPGDEARDVEAFVALILADDQPAVRALTTRVMSAPGGRKKLLMLLTESARHTGRLWERDLCDFMDVTICVHRLDMLMRETEFADGQAPVLHSHQHRALLLPAPGEQHRFGIAMVADVFRAGGWRVSSGAAVPRTRLVRRVREQWFDVVGLSISAERDLGSVATCLREIRQASRNRNLLIMLGGNAIAGHEERSRFLGADLVAADAYQALEDANMMMTTAETWHNPQEYRQSTLT